MIVWFGYLMTKKHQSALSDHPEIVGGVSAEYGKTGGRHEKSAIYLKHNKIKTLY